MRIKLAANKMPEKRRQKRCRGKLFIFPCLSAGAEIVGGGAGPSGRGAEGAGGAAEEEGAGAGREGDRHCWARAEHHHPPDVPGEAQRQEEEGPLQEEPVTEAGQRQQLYQSALWWVHTGITPGQF